MQDTDQAQKEIRESKPIDEGPVDIEMEEQIEVRDFEMDHSPVFG